jgi:hypothetical protein
VAGTDAGIVVPETEFVPTDVEVITVVAVAVVVVVWFA